LSIAQDLVFWFFSELLIPLLKVRALLRFIALSPSPHVTHAQNTFYITETAATRYETVYHLHADWARVAEPHFAELERGLLEPLTAVRLRLRPRRSATSAELSAGNGSTADASQDEAYFARRATLGVSSVRLVPKPNGFRPIVNMGKRIVSFALSTPMPLRCL
jgi:hypothetical protein